MIRRWVATGLAGALIGLMAATAAAQGAQEDLQEKLKDKLAEEWVANGSWVTDYDKAREQAKESGKPIVAYFTRSYAP